MPEATHMVMWTMSDRAIPRSFRFMEGFGVHSFRFVNAAGESTFVKFHWKPKLGLQSVVWNEAVKINGADPDFHRRDLWDADQQRRLPRVGARRAAVRRRLRRRVRLRHPRRHQDHPRGARAGRAGSAGSCSTARSTTSSPRPSRWPSAPRTSCPASTSPTIRCCRAATSPTSTPSSSGSAARTSPTCRSTRRSARSPTSSRTATWPFVNPVGRVNYEPNSWSGDAGGPREDPAGGYRTYAEDARSHQAARPIRALRRPLQPGAPVLRQPDARRAGPHRRRLRLRAEQVRTARHPRPDGRQPAQRRRRASPGASPTASASTRYPEPSKPARPPITDLPPSPALSIVAQRTRDLRRPQDRRPRHRRHRRHAARGAAQGSRRPRARLVELVAPAIGGVVTSDGDAASRPTRRSTVDRRCSTTPSRSCRRPRAPPRWPHDPAAKDFVTDAHAHCKFIAYHPAARPLLEAAGVAAELDDGYIALERRNAATTFIEQCRSVRYWQRTPRYPATLLAVAITG